MTTSRYFCDDLFNSLILSESEWKTFTKEILTSCFFSVPVTRHSAYLGGNRYMISSKSIKARFYQKDKIVYYHVTNDSRKIIQRYLREKYSIL